MKARGLRLFQQKFKILPKLTLVSDRFCRNVTQFVDCNKCQRVLVNHRVAILLCVQAECQLFALVLTVCRVFTCGEGLHHFLGIESIDQAFHILLVGKLFANILDEFLALFRHFCQQIGGILHLARLSDAVFIAIHCRNNAFQLEFALFIIHIRTYTNYKNYNDIHKNVVFVHIIIY